MSQRCAEESCGDIALFDGWCLLCAANHYRQRSAHLESLVAEAVAVGILYENGGADPVRLTAFLDRARDGEGVAENETTETLVYVADEGGLPPTSGILLHPGDDYEIRTHKGFRVVSLHKDALRTMAEAERDRLREALRKAVGALAAGLDYAGERRYPQEEVEEFVVRATGLVMEMSALLYEKGGS